MSQNKRRVVSRRRASSATKTSTPFSDQSVRSKKIIVSWEGAEFAYGETEIEQAVMFALRYAINLRKVVHVDHNGRGIAEFDGVYLATLPRYIPEWVKNMTITGTLVEVNKKKRTVTIKRRKQ